MIGLSDWRGRKYKNISDCINLLVFYLKRSEL